MCAKEAAFQGAEIAQKLKAEGKLKDDGRRIIFHGHGSYENAQNYMNKYENMLPKMLQKQYKNHQKCFLNGLRGAPGERSWNLPRGTGEKTPILS